MWRVTGAAAVMHEQFTATATRIASRVHQRMPINQRQQAYSGNSNLKTYSGNSRRRKK
jgi:hypothetical protein